MMKKILLPTVDLGIGGVSNYIRAIKQTFPTDVEILELASNIPWRQAFSRLRGINQKFEQIWVHHISPIGTASMLISLLTGLPYTVFLHGLDFDQARRSMIRRLLAKIILRLAQCVVTNSRALADEVEAFSGVEPLVVYPCVSDELVEASRQEQVSAKENGQIVRLLTVARLVPRKGHALVLEAMKNLPSVHYTIVGDGPERATLEQQIDYLGLTSRVHLITNATDDQLADFYRSANIFLMPAKKTSDDREGFGIVYLEAGLFGLPVIAISQPGVNEAVLHGETGILVDDQIAELRAAIERLAQNAQLRSKLGAAGRERVLNFFTRADQFEKLRPLVEREIRDDENCEVHGVTAIHEIDHLVSVVVPTFQHATTISRCLDSILNQTYRNLEIIVVNDGSTDNTEQVLEAYADRVKIIHQENRGANSARNRGWRDATGEFIIFCDADVRMRPEMIEELLVALAQHPEASYAYSAFRFGWKRFRGIEFSAERLRERNFIHTSSLIRRADFPGFDESIHRLQDWDVWLTMLTAGKTGVLVPVELFHVAVRGTSRIGSSWLPAFVYQIPWGQLPWQPRSIARYEAARAVIMQKHQL
jgi:phosphatidylinositol alpha-1,6-mannosyltransferase